MSILTFLMIPLSIALIFLILFFVILIHEMGHYWVGRLLRFPIKSVVIGRGMSLIKWKDKIGAGWELRLIPFGAFVDFHAPVGGDEHKDSFELKPYWQRICVILAGPLANLILPFIAFPLLYMTIGQPSGPPFIAGIEKGLAADLHGLKPGDQFLAVDGQPLKNYKDIWDIAYAKGPVESLYTIKRGDKIFEKRIKPGWLEYKTDGIDRKNARFGIVWEHRPMTIKHIISINGVELEKDTDKGRELLKSLLGQEIVVGLKGVDGRDVQNIHYFLSAKNNQHLFDPKDMFYNSVFLSEHKGNFFLKETPLEAFEAGTKRALELISGIATIPIQLLPVDPQIIKEPHPVGGEEYAMHARIVQIVHGACFISIFLGLINLLPFPRLDGDYIFIQTLEKIKGSPLTLKQKANFYAGVFVVIYSVIFFSNMDNLAYYIDSRSEKLHQFISES